MMEFSKITATIILLFCGYSYQASDWNYEEETNWPGTCRIGAAQSPINLSPRTAVLDKRRIHIRSPLRMRGYTGVNMEAVNNGHTLKWTVKSEPRPVLSGGPLRANYSLVQFHLHWLSEHAIDSIKYPMEIHLVHLKTGLTLEQAVQRPDGLAVVGILCHADSSKNSHLTIQQLMRTVPLLMQKTAAPVSAGSIDISNFISPVPQSFYTYKGSLTTPACQESVIWIVMDKPIHISDVQYKLITKANVGGVHNYRSLQPANRLVYRSTASCLSLAVPNLLFALRTALSCMSVNAIAKLYRSFCKMGNFKKKIFGETPKVCDDVDN